MGSQAEQHSGPAKQDLAGAAEWLSNNKLKTVGGLWGSAMAASLAYSCFRRPMLKPSLRLIHARMYAQGFTLAALSSAALLHFFEGKASSSSSSSSSSTDSTAPVPLAGDIFLASPLDISP